MSELICYEVRGHVATIRLNRPELHNALDDIMMLRITDFVRRSGGDDSVRAVVIRGEGKSFCAGADVQWMRRMVGFSFEENVADANVLAEMLRSIRECPKPVIARVHGPAIGGGVGLAAAADLAVALESAVFCLSEVKLGIVPAVISPYVLERIGMSAMRRYAVTAERFSAAEAWRIGLVHEVVVAESDMDAWVLQQVSLIAHNGPEAISCCKQVLREVSGHDWDALQAMTTRRIAERRVSREGQEGLLGFLEKRAPAWRPSDL